jgi:hypothetical protein
MTGLLSAQWRPSRHRDPWPEKRSFLPRVSNIEKICRTMSISDKLVRRPDETPKKAGSNKEVNDAGYGVRESH